MIPRFFSILLVVSTVSVSGQSLSDMARRASDERNSGAKSKRTYTSKDLSGVARVDAVLGDFVMTEELTYRCRDAQLSVVKARRLDVALDRYLLKWEFATRGDAFGMEQPYKSEPKLLKLFDRENVDVADCLLFQAALSRAAGDRLELKTSRVSLTPPRLANAKFLDTHESILQPSIEMKTAEEDLARDRQYRVR
jgi:hypothetical protein